VPPNNNNNNNIVVVFVVFFVVMALSIRADLWNVLQDVINIELIAASDLL